MCNYANYPGGVESPEQRKSGPGFISPVVVDHKQGFIQEYVAAVAEDVDCAADQGSRKWVVNANFCNYYIPGLLSHPTQIAYRCDYSGQWTQISGNVRANEICFSLTCITIYSNYWFIHHKFTITLVVD